MAALRASKDADGRKETPARAGLPPGVDIPPHVFVDCKVVPTALEGGVLSVLADEESLLPPLEVVVQARGLQLHLELGEADKMAIGLGDLRKAALAEAAGQASAGRADLLDGSPAVEPPQRALRQLVAQALARKASDIHLEPGPESYTLRLRVEGEMETVETLPASVGAEVVAQVKVAARIPLAEQRLPHDGRLAVEAVGKRVEMRASILPAVAGQALVLRLLGDEGPQSLQALAMPPLVRSAVSAALAQRSGLLLVAGPTGSGKTTTLYALMRRLAEPGRKLISVEDPVESFLPGVNQVPVGRGGMSFPSAIRAMLRHAPEVIMIGEIRDGETARAAAEAALTGHLVVASIHARDAAEGVARLVELGVPGHLLASVLSLVVEQRLVRRLCPSCRTHAHLRVAQRNVLQVVENAESPVFDAGPGCAHCNRRGYVGRFAVFGILRPRRLVTAAIASGASTARLRALSYESGDTGLMEHVSSALLSGECGLRDALLAASFAPAADILSEPSSRESNEPTPDQR